MFVRPPLFGEVSCFGPTQLGSFLNRPVEKLSGGMKKKLGLCCTLIHSPEILFLDEPTNGVDPLSRQEFWKILYEFLSEGITILASTSYMDEAERFTGDGERSGPGQSRASRPGQNQGGADHHGLRRSIAAPRGPGRRTEAGHARRRDLYASGSGGPVTPRPAAEVTAEGAGPCSL